MVKNVGYSPRKKNSNSWTSYYKDKNIFKFDQKCIKKKA